MRSYFTYKPVKLRASMMERINVQMVEKDELLDDRDFGILDAKNKRLSAKQYVPFTSIRTSGIEVKEKHNYL